MVVGEGPGATKIRRAEELGVPVVDAAGFAVLLETGELPGDRGGAVPGAGDGAGGAAGPQGSAALHRRAGPGR